MKIFKTILFIILFQILTITYCSSQEIIIESRSEGHNYSFYKEYGTGWADSTAKSLADGLTPGIGSRFLTIDNTLPKAFFEVIPKMPEAGKYDISVSFGTSANAENCKYEITIKNSIAKTVLINQRGWGNPQENEAGNGNVWVSLGVFEIPAGEETILTGSPDQITGKNSSINSGRFYADAFRFTPVDKDGKLKITGTSLSLAPKTGTGPKAPLGALTWLEDYNQAIQKAKTENKPVLLFFYSELGKVSMQVETTVLNSQKVQPYLEKYILCKIKITDSANSRLSEYYQVFKAPTFIYLDSKGWMRDREDRTVDVTTMISRLIKNNTP